MGVYTTFCFYLDQASDGSGSILEKLHGAHPLWNSWKSPCEEVHKIIERVSPPDYLELFARRRQPGWDVWGNEIDSDIIIPGYPVPKYSAKALGEEG